MMARALLLSSFPDSIVSDISLISTSGNR
jgi:hypothetical protein